MLPFWLPREAKLDISARAVSVEKGIDRLWYGQSTKGKERRAPGMNALSLIDPSLPWPFFFDVTRPITMI